MPDEMSSRLDEIDPTKYTPPIPRGLHPLERIAIATFGFQLNPDGTHDQYRWLWHEAVPLVRSQVLSALWQYDYVRRYLFGKGVVSSMEATEESELLRYADRAYSDLPEALRILTVYADGGGGLHPDHVDYHCIHLLSPEQLQQLRDKLASEVPGSMCPPRHLLLEGDWAEN